MLIVVLGGLITVLAALREIRALAGGLWRGLAKVIASPDPLLIQLDDAVDAVGYRFTRPFRENPEDHPRLFALSFVPWTTWLAHPSWGLASYRRHVKALLEDDTWRRSRRSNRLSHNSL
jgi:hypothetical protein